MGKHGEDRMYSRTWVNMVFTTFAPDLLSIFSSSVCVFVCLCLFVCLFVCVYVYEHAWFYACMHVYLHVYLLVCLLCSVPRWLECRPSRTYSTQIICKYSAFYDVNPLSSISSCSLSARFRIIPEVEEYQIRSQDNVLYERYVDPRAPNEHVS